MTERAERLARPAARQSIGRKSQIAANARPPAPFCTTAPPGNEGFCVSPLFGRGTCVITAGCGLLLGPTVHQHAPSRWYSPGRSEERRVGKEGRSRWSPY